MLQLAGCGELTEGFENRLDEAWACAGFNYELVNDPEAGGLHRDSVGYHAHSPTESIRLDIRQGFDPFDRNADLPLGSHEFDVDDGSLRVYTGGGLVVDDGENRCDDVVDANVLSARFRIDHVYEAIEGRYVMEFSEDPFRVGIELFGVNLRQNDDLASDVEGSEVTLEDVFIEEARLPEARVVF